LTILIGSQSKAWSLRSHHTSENEVRGKIFIGVEISNSHSRDKHLQNSSKFVHLTSVELKIIAFVSSVDIRTHSPAKQALIIYSP
jgi:hypothetical protein